jgi:hypothetical protein
VFEARYAELEFLMLADLVVCVSDLPVQIIALVFLLFVSIGVLLVLGLFQLDETVGFSLSA